MPDPISQLVGAAGVDCTITTFATADSADYDPNDATFTPGAPTSPTVRVVPGKLTDEMLAAKFEGHFLAVTIPAGVEAGQSKLTYGGVVYTVQQIRKRVFLGVQNGWSLVCSI